MALSISSVINETALLNPSVMVVLISSILLLTADTILVHIEDIVEEIVFIIDEIVEEIVLNTPDTVFFILSKIGDRKPTIAFHTEVMMFCTVVI